MTFRATARVLLIDPTDAVLLFLHYGKSHEVPPRWITPGGGVDPGEDMQQAGLRELHEETGLVLDSLPAPFLEEDFAPDQRWHPYDDGHWAWFSLRHERFEPSREGWTDEELVDIVEGRWLTADELEAEGHEYEPANLPELIRSRAAVA